MFAPSSKRRYTETPVATCSAESVRGDPATRVTGALYLVLIVRKGDCELLMALSARDATFVRKVHVFGDDERITNQASAIGQETKRGDSAEKKRRQVDGRCTAGRIEKARQFGDVVADVSRIHQGRRRGHIGR